MADSYLSDVDNLDSTEGYAEPDEAASDELADGVDLLEELNGPSLRERVLEWTQQRPRATLGIVFGIGLIIGWFLIGWVIFPPQWHKTAPWDMSEERQRLYLRLVAEEYWHTDDAKVVYDALDGWDQDELGILLTDMLRDNELTADNRQHVLGLAQALDLATYEQPLLASLLFNNTAILVTALLSSVPMLLALTIIAAPVVRQYASEEGRTAIAEAIASALGNDDLDDEDEDDEYDDLGNLISSAASGSMAIFEDVVIDEDEEEARDSEEEMGAAGGYANGQPQGIQSIISGPDAEESVDVGDMINDLFDEDDEDKERLEALAKQLEDVDLDDLLKQAREMADELTKMVDWEARRAA